jgi:drug/metabolite transporter (DMT)-like permease
MTPSTLGQRLRNLGWIVLLGSCWGPSYVLIKFALAELTPLTIVFGRIALAAVILFAILRWRGGQLPRFGMIWVHYTMMGLISMGLPFYLISVGEQYIHSSLAAVINGSAPIFTVLVAHFLIPEEKLTGNKLAGVGLGLVGLVVIFWPALQAGLSGQVLGAALVAGAAASYALGFVYARRFLSHQPPLVAPTAQMISGTLWLLPIWLWKDLGQLAVIPSWSSLSAVATLGLWGTATASILYYKIVEKCGASGLSMVTFLLPLYGLLFGALFMGEGLALATGLGAGCILLGLLASQGLLSRRQPAAQA